MIFSAKFPRKFCRWGRSAINGRHIPERHRSNLQQFY